MAAAGNYALVSPVVAVLIAIPLLGEHVSAMDTIGICLTLSAALLALRL